MYEAGFGMPPLRGALSQLHRPSFYQVSQLLVDALSFLSRWLRVRSHDHGGRCNILAGPREDGCLPPTLLDLIVHSACPRPRALGIEVLQARASVFVAFVGQISFLSHGSF